MSTEEESKPMEGPFSPGWVASSVKISQTPKADHEVKSAKKITPSRTKTTPKGRHTSPQSEFGYDDAYSVGGDDFADAAVRKVKTGTRRRSPKKKFQKAKQSFLAPTSCSTVRQRSKTAAFEHTPAAKTEQTKSLTVPVSPHFRKVVAKSKEQMLTSEELLLQKLNQEKHAEAERIAKAQKMYAVLKSRSSRRKSKLYGNAVLESAVKQPKAPAVRQFVQPKKVAAPSAVQASAIKRGQDGLTLFEPFQFATDKRVTIAAPLNTPDRVRAIPTAELAQNFMRDSRSHGAPENAAKKLTIGQSPKLRTQKRGQYAATSKPRLPTQDERVSAEMEEIRSHPFRARRLDRRIFDSAGELGVPKVAARPVTEPREFEFRADKRSTTRVRASTSVSPTKRSTTSFKARPAPSTSGKMPVKAKTVFKPTVAMSPKFNGGSRASIAPARRQRVPFSLTAATTISAPAEPLRLTEPKEFKFRSDNRGDFHKAQLEKQIALEQEALAAARERKAQPMPDFNKPVFQPDLVSHKAPATETKPFQLRSSARHADAVSAFQQEVSHLTEAEKCVVFHARPVPATTYKPDYEFTEPADHTPVVPLPITLESERRALKRQEFDLVMGQKMAQLEVMQESLAKQKLEQENERIKELRRKSVEDGGLMFKAKPIITKDQFPTKFVPSAPLTTPLSPQLRTATKIRPSLVNTNSTPLVSKSSSVVKSSGLGGGAKRVSSATVSDKAQQQSTELAQALSAM